MGSAPVTPSRGGVMARLAGASPGHVVLDTRVDDRAGAIRSDAAAEPLPPAELVEVLGDLGLEAGVRAQREAAVFDQLVVEEVLEIEVAKFLARNGPSGWYSQACRSRADQSLSRP